MRKLILSSLLACSLVFVSCEQSTNESASAAPTPESAAQLRENNVALLKNLQALKGQIESRSAMRLAARSSASTVEFDTTMGMEPDFGMLKTQIRTSLQAQGVCQAWIDWIVDFFDLIEEMNADLMSSSEADASAMQDKMMTLFNKAFACLEPLFADISGEESPNPAAMMAQFQEFDKCMCGEGGGSIFGTSAALVYGYYGLPSTGTPYSAPTSAGGESYGAPGSPAGSGYGAPKLFPE